MAPQPPSRSIGELTSPDISRYLKETSILCLPLGAIEQHGRHLPLNTDLIVAEGLAKRIVTRAGEAFDLWQLPALPLGLSREHDWAPGTLSLSVRTFASVLREYAREVVRSLPARNLAIVNCHGGNRGVLENLLHELRGDFGLNACAIHPFDLAKVDTGPGFDVHGGKSETSVMLALAPDQVRREMMRHPEDPPDQKNIQELIFDRGTTWPWRTDDPRLARDGIIGDAAEASAELGETIIESVVRGSGAIFQRLLENQKLMPGGGVR
jgi:creatinine amidohydrolase/Fe(II)-dependent formamide hydrolase-like protein